MTHQSADILIYQDKTYYIYGEPLRAYLEQADLPYPLVAPNTACWRGYYAKYVIQSSKLFLIEWNGYIKDCMKVGMDYLFPGETFVFADWFTGDIRIGALGRFLASGGSYPIHEGRLMLQFEQGLFIKEFEKWLPKEEADRLEEEEKKDIPF